MLQSSHELDDSSDESGGIQLEGSNSLKALDESLAEPRLEDRTLVFFDLKIDEESGFPKTYPTSL